VILGVGVALFWAGFLALLYGFELPLPDAILLAVLLLAVPALATAQVPLVAGTSIERLPAYWGSIAALWLLGAAAWLVGTRDEGAQALGFVGLPPHLLAAWTTGLTLGAFLIIVVFRTIAERMGTQESSLLQDLLPRTRREKEVFTLLSVAAGVGEEVAYRGYAIGALTPLLGAGGAATVTSIVFGVLHGYQGWLGTARTALMGALLAWGFLASGSIWPSIVAHTTVDLVAGIVLGEKLLSPARSAGVVGALVGSAEADMHSDSGGGA
jgi:membrane protease YdiL (CAAX protease family)